MMLSPNFSLQELTRSQTAARKGISNVPPPEVVENLRLVCTQVLEPVRRHFGRPVLVSSGYRSPAVNKAIGGSRSSQHMTGEAADFEIVGLPNYELASWIEENLEFDQLILEFYSPGEPSSGWVHCSYRKDRLRKQVLTAQRISGRTKYISGLIR